MSGRNSYGTDIYTEPDGDPDTLTRVAPPTPNPLAAGPIAQSGDGSLGIGALRGEAPGI